MSRPGSSGPGVSGLPAELRCEDVAELGALYLDGELDGAERGAVDCHVGACAACAGRLEEQLGWKTMLRAHAAATPPAPAALAARVRAGLDDADARGLGPRPSLVRRLTPVVALVGVAAAMGLFLSTAARRPEGGAGPAMVADAVTAHERNLPVEVGGSPERVTDWMRGKVGVPVQPPRFAQPRPPRGDRGPSEVSGGAAQASLVGGRLSHLSSREAAQLSYRVGDDAVSVYVFDPAGLPLEELPVVRVRGQALQVATVRGYSVIFMRRDGVGYAFTSAMSQDALLELVAANL